MDSVEKDERTFAVSNRTVSRVIRNRGRFSFAIVCLRLKFDPRLRSGSRRQRHFGGTERRTGDPRPIHFSQAADQLFGARLFTGLLGHLAISETVFTIFTLLATGTRD